MTRTLTLSTLALVSLAAGCERGVRAPYSGRYDTHPRTQIFFSGDDGDRLDRATTAGDPVVTRDPQTNLLRVTVPVRSDVNRTLYVEYQATFLDAAGQQISQLAWMPKTLEANVPNEVTFTSLSANAADFRVAFRYAR